MTRGHPERGFRVFKSKEAWRKNAAWIHIHGVPHHPSSVTVLSNGTVRVKPRVKYEVIACPVCGKHYKKDVRVLAGHGCPHCVARSRTPRRHLGHYRLR